MKKGKKFDGCQVERRMLIKHGTLDLVTLKETVGKEEWVTQPCNVPLFGEPESTTGMCRSCAKGWTHEHNFATKKGLAYIAKHAGAK